MYGLATVDRPLRYGMVVAVRSLTDLVYLVKESEVIKGGAGREFFVPHATHPRSYYIASHDGGFDVAALREDGTLKEACFVLPEELDQGPLCGAIAAGTLFSGAL